MRPEDKGLALVVLAIVAAWVIIILGVL